MLVHTEGVLGLVHHGRLLVRVVIVGTRSLVADFLRGRLLRVGDRVAVEGSKSAYADE